MGSASRNILLSSSSDVEYGLTEEATLGGSWDATVGDDEAIPLDGEATLFIRDTSSLD